MMRRSLETNFKFMGCGLFIYIYFKPSLMALIPTGLLKIRGRASKLQQEGHRFDSCWELTRIFSVLAYQSQLPKKKHHSHFIVFHFEVKTTIKYKIAIVAFSE